MGAIAWDVVSCFLEGISHLGAPLALIAGIGVTNWRHSGGWGTAMAVGPVGWLVAGAVLYGLSTVGRVAASALGVPGV